MLIKFIKKVLFLFCILTPILSDAQELKKKFSEAVDAINCATIKFIHNERGRLKEAGMECFSGYEGILKTIPEDEMSTTGKLAKEINAFKTKYNPDADFGKQLDKVISYSSNKITSKPRKGDKEKFKSDLTAIKTDAMAGIKSAGETSVSSENSKPTSDTTQIASTTSTPNEESEIMPELSPATSINWLGWAAFVLSLIAIFVCFLLYMNFKRLSEEVMAWQNDPANKVTISNDNTSLNLKNLEQKMEGEILKLDEKVNNLNALFKTASPKMTDEYRVTPDLDTESQSTEPKREYTLPIELENRFNSEEDVEAAVESNSKSNDEIIRHELVLEDSDSEELLPLYKYSSIPEKGRFTDENFTTSPEEDSIFEIEMYKNNPNKAFFSILPYHEVVEKAFSNPELYLIPYCRFEQEPSGKNKISLIEEGMLEKVQNEWVIVEKARIKLDE